MQEVRDKRSAYERATKTLFLAAMAHAGNPGSQVLPVWSGTDGTLLTAPQRSVRAWIVATTEERAWYLGEDGFVYVRGYFRRTKWGKMRTELCLKGNVSLSPEVDLASRLRARAGELGVALPAPTDSVRAAQNDTERPPAIDERHYAP